MPGSRLLRGTEAPGAPQPQPPGQGTAGRPRDALTVFVSKGRGGFWIHKHGVNENLVSPALCCDLDINGLHVWSRLPINVFFFFFSSNDFNYKLSFWKELLTPRLMCVLTDCPQGICTDAKKKKKSS